MKAASGLVVVGLACVVYAWSVIGAFAQPTAARECLRRGVPVPVRERARHGRRHDPEEVRLLRVHRGRRRQRPQGQLQRHGRQGDAHRLRHDHVARRRRNARDVQRYGETERDADDVHDRHRRPRRARLGPRSVRDQDRSRLLALRPPVVGRHPGPRALAAPAPPRAGERNVGAHPATRLTGCRPAIAIPTARPASRAPSATARSAPNACG